MTLSGILFFPVTPYNTSGGVDAGLLSEHISSRLDYSPGAVFAACGTGEFNALSSSEVGAVVRVAVETTSGRSPVFAGAGGPLGHALECVRHAADAGADGILLLPPYLAGGTTDGLVAWAETIADASDLPVVLYHRGTAVYSAAAVARLSAHPRIVGFKDGIGDVGVVQEIVSAVRATGRDDFMFFNGLLTAELSQGAYRGLGVPLYSSAAFAMIPEVAMAYYTAYESGDEERRLELIRGFYAPLVRLRDQAPGFGVSLIKAGIRLSGLPVGPVRSPLVDPSPAQVEELSRILDAGRELLAR
jgi:5-dehydro-4-deoxyglucarate dehydratase